jgi:hypothetical protein
MNSTIENYKKIPIFVIGNKTDLYESIEVEYYIFIKLNK